MDGHVFVHVGFELQSIFGEKKSEITFEAIHLLSEFFRNKTPPESIWMFLKMMVPPNHPL